MISIVIPAYNYAHYLGDAIRSILRQDVTDIEVIVCDDCSTDDTRQVVESFSREDDRIAYFLNERNLGATPNINQAMKRARGEYIVLLGADDMLEPGSLETLKATLDAHPECGYAFGRYTLLDSEGRSIALQHPGWWNRDYFGERDEFADLLKYDLYINIGAAMFRREVLENREFFDLSLSAFESERFFRATDLALMLDLSLLGVKSAFVNRNMSVFRVHSAQASSVDRYAKSGLAFFEYSVLLQRYVTAGTIERVLPNLNDILQLYASKLACLKTYGGQEYADRIQISDARAGEVLESIKQAIVAHNERLKPKPFDLQITPISRDGNQGQCFFTVVFTTYDRPHLASAALQSIAAQTFRDFEVIVVNDGGAPQEMFVDLLAKTCNVTYVRQPNRGVAAARNLALKLARGRYIVYLDDDDIMYSHHLARLHHEACQHPDALVFGNAEVVYEQLESGLRKELQKSIMACAQYDFHRLQIANYIPINVLAHPRTVIEQLGGFDEALPSHEDWEFLMRISRKIPFVHFDDTTVQVRRRVGNGNVFYDSRTGKAWDSMREDYAEIYRRHDDMGIVQIREARGKILAAQHPTQAKF